MAKFQKGQSGNPGGRPKVVGEIQELARSYTNEAINTLAGIMRNAKAPAAARALAANSILDRGYGRPAQSLDVGINRKNVEDMSDADLLAIAAGADDEEDAPTSARQH